MLEEIESGRARDRHAQSRQRRDADNGDERDDERVLRQPLSRLRGLTRISLAARDVLISSSCHDARLLSSECYLLYVRPSVEARTESPGDECVAHE